MLREIFVKVEDFGYNIFTLGVVAENEYRTIKVDCTEWLNDLPDALISFVFKRPDGVTYAYQGVRTSGNIFSWSPDSNDVVAKTITAVAKILPSLSGTIGPSQTYPSWVTEVLDAANDAIVASQHYPYIGENGDWFLWDVDLEEFIDTGISAVVVTQESIEEALGYTPANEEVLEEHLDNFTNPHEVNQDQVGLGNVDDTSDIDKPISRDTQAALDQKIGSSDYATLASGGTVRINPDYGIAIDTNSPLAGTIYVVRVSEDDIDEIWEES